MHTPGVAYFQITEAISQAYECTVQAELEGLEKLENLAAIDCMINRLSKAFPVIFLSIITQCTAFHRVECFKQDCF